MNPGQVRRGQPVSDFFVEYSSAIPRRARITLFDKNSRIAQSEQVLKSGSHRIALATSSYRFNPAENCFIVQVEMLDNSTRTHREQECAQRLGIADVWTLKFRRTN